MPKISRLDRHEVTPETGEIYDRYLLTRGNVPNMFRTVAHRPEIFQTMIAHFEAILTTGTLTTKLKELVIIRTSQLNHCNYCLASHRRIGMKLGWSQEQLDNLAEYATRTDFSASEKAALHLAEQMTRNEGAISDEEMARLREHYSEGEIIELMASIGLFNYFNRFNNLLDMEPTNTGAEAEAQAVALEPASR
ncbi:MAG TPA: carboxymuconolactone decarboxylase family protein [Acidobacteriaceae bacterium]|nr:carboxymuconolactone decarboxylase family protein [Acidobacteriaceae bacterium]